MPRISAGIDPKAIATLMRRPYAGSANSSPACASWLRSRAGTKVMSV